MSANCDEGLVEPDQGINLLWLTISLGAMLLLASQMGRVHESWLRRRDSKRQQAIPALLP